MRGSVRSIVVRLSLVVGLLCAGVLGLAGCRPASVPRVVKIGLVGSFEGLYRGTGYEALFAVKLALEEWNARGGVAGHPVELVALDDSGNPEQARQKPAELAQDPDVLGVVGHAQMDTTESALAEYDRLGLPLVSPAAWTRNPDSEWVFFVGAAFVQEAVAALRGAGLEFGARIAVVGGGEDWPRLSSWAATLLSPDEPVPTDAAAVVLAVPAASAAEWVQTSEQRPGLVLAGGSDLGSGVFEELAGERAAGVWIGHTAVGAGPNEWESFRQRYTALAGSEPGVLAALAYDSANVLLAAMERAAESRELSRETVANALQQTDWDGLTGHIAFGSDGSRTDVQVTANRMPLPGS